MVHLHHLQPCNSFNFIKGVLYARSSKLIPDKANLGFRFPCDPGRGGTCQSSSWDHVFLGLFWMYNQFLL
jgi:photosystem I P700 chlorophyll a apoprotein A1